MSHFEFHAGEQHSTVDEKLALFQPMLGQLGALGVGAGLLALGALGVPRWAVAGCVLVGAYGITLVCLTPGADAVLIPRKLTLPTLVFVTLGAGSALAVLAAAGVGVLPPTRDGLFLAGWLLLELAGYFALTPFPAARRVMALSVVGTLLAARLAGSHRPPRWVPAAGVAAGLGLFALDTWDAMPEKVLAERAADVVGDPGPHAVWFHGHWGFQYYCDRLGMRPVVPGVSVLREGDWLVFPVIPDPWGFYRPYHGEAKFTPDPDCLVEVSEFVWDDRLPAQTIPSLYGGGLPVTGRAAPRLRVRVYRVTRDWVPR